MIAKTHFKNICFALRSKIMLCDIKFHFKQNLNGEEHQHTTSPFLF